MAEHARTGSLTVVSGFSGAGKGTLMKELLGRYDNYALSVSMTTRTPREGEVNGREYFFVTQEEFDREVEAGGLLEHAGYVNHSYGTPRRYVEEKMAEGKDVVLEIEVQGARQVKEKFPGANFIFVITPSAEVLRQRLKGRGSEDEETIRGRLLRAVEEAEEIPMYDFILVNDDLSEAVQQLHESIQTAKTRPAAMKEFTDVFVSELRSITE